MTIDDQPETVKPDEAPKRIWARSYHHTPGEDGYWTNDPNSFVAGEATTITYVRAADYDEAIAALEAVREFWKSGGLVDSFNNAREKLESAIAKSKEQS